MFNTYHAGNHINNIKINAVTGAILKNHPKSWFERFNLKSERATALFKEGGHHAQKQVWKEADWMSDGGYNTTVHDSDMDIIILQMVICGDMEVMAELVYAKDYNMEIEQK